MNNRKPQKILKAKWFQLALLSPILTLLSAYSTPAFAVGDAPAAAVKTTRLTQACRHPDFAQEIQCGSLLQPLNPAQPEGKKIQLNFVVLPAQDKNKLNDAVVLLAGGPGQSVINLAAYAKLALSRNNRRRDIVLLDQRGTGKSAPLSCDEFADTFAIVKPAQLETRTRQCLQKLQALDYGELSYFSTSIAVRDLEALRRHLNYDSLNLIGVSYGTRVALEYQRQFPNSVRRMVLDGVVPPDLSLASADAKVALEALFKACQQEAACAKSYPDLAQKWSNLLKQSPFNYSFAHPRTGQLVEREISADLMIGLVHKILYNPVTSMTIPYVLSQAASGNYVPLLSISNALAKPGPEGIYYGMHFSVWCAEAAAIPLKTAPAQDEIASSMAKMYQSVCRNWPRAEIPADFYQIKPSPVAALLLSGGIDPVTPDSQGQKVADALGKNALHLRLQNAGHGLLMQGCSRDIVERFISAKDDQSALAVDRQCLRHIPRPLAWQPTVIASGELK